MIFRRVCFVVAVFGGANVFATKKFIIHLARNTNSELVHEQILGIVGTSGGAVTTLLERDRLLADLSQQSEARVRILPGIVGVFQYSPAPLGQTANNVFYRISTDPFLSDADHARVVSSIEKIALRPEAGSGYVVQTSGRSLIANLRPHAAREVAAIAGVTSVDPSDSSGDKACESLFE